MGGPLSDFQHGRWTLQVRGDEVADIRWDGVLLLRAIRPVVRDRDWNTVPVRVLEETAVEVGPALVCRRSLAFEAEGVDYVGRLELRLEDDDLVVAFDGEARAAFERNRVGLVVLHPAVCAGTPVDVRHPDGRLEAGRWPTAISPHQPFTDVAGFAWEVDGVAAELSLSGDVFETEDQRNWTDASFKTYSTPLSLPFPVPLAPGDRCRQSARLRASGSPAVHPAPPRDRVQVSTQVVGTVLPVSLGAALYPPAAAVAGLGTGIEAVLVELTGAEDLWPALLATAGAQAEALGAGLDVRVVTAEPGAVRRAVALLADRPVLRLAAFDPDRHLSSSPLWTALRDEAGRRGLPATLLGGTRAHFTELNRLQHEMPADAGALTFSLTPQMHATEVPHILDSLATQRTVVENAVRIADGRPLHVGPVTLARRFNAVATGPRPDPATEAARAVDPLLDTDLAAAWTLASVAALSILGVAGLTYYETAGPRGLLRPDQTPRPAAAVLTRLAGLRGRPLLGVTAPAGLAALAVADGGGTVVLLGNLQPAEQTVTVADDRSETVVSLEGWGFAEVRLG